MPDFIPARAIDEVIARLSTVRGIGPWTAQVYLLFALGRTDIWPAGDLGLQIAVQRFKGLPTRPKAADLILLAAPWRPWRSVAACLLWQSYLHALGRLGDRPSAAGMRKTPP